MALVGGIIYPAVVQALVVNPNQRDREAPYIERNVLATRHALGIDNVEPVGLQIDDVIGERTSRRAHPRCRTCAC